MYIAPNTTVRILKGVPLTPDYKDTLYFGSLAEQTNYFAGKTAALLTQQSYVRKERGVIKAEVRADSIYSANYLMYQNSAYGNKWFYAFITSVEYDNNSTAIITFEIDDLQTWLFNYSTPPCLVERCHSYRDNIGDNIVPEPVDTGDMVPNDQTSIHASNPNAAFYNQPILAVSFINPEGSENKGHLLENVFTTGEMFYYDMSTDAGVQAAVDWLGSISSEYFNSIVGMWMVPRWAVGFGIEDKWINTRHGEVYRFYLPAVHPGTQLDGYTPKNNKMYTYPYNLLQINTASGNQMALRYEFYDGQEVALEETWNIAEPASSVLRPISYRGITDSSKDICLSLEGFPMAMWSGDAYKAWVAQNKVSIVSNVLEILGGLAAAAFTGGTSLAATAHGISNLVSSNHKASIAADQRGGGSSGSNAWSNNQMDYYACRMSCTHDKAAMIDGFFSAYGYAQGVIMRPPTHNRRSYTYVKTDGAIITGDLPAEAAARIRGIYDNGIRWWSNHTSFGNLNIDNYTL